MRDHNVGSLVVLENGVLAGIVTDRDILTRGVAEGRGLSAPVESVMSGNVAFTFEGDDLESAATLMASRGLRRLPVLDVRGKVTGMLAFDDLISLFADQIQRLSFAVRSEIRHGGAEARQAESEPARHRPRR
jgi:CBS domain-containing protein